jgi:RHS repeat-associated protein
MITDANGAVQQQVLYAPFGEVISEYNAYWHQGKVPDYMFNAKEMDEESGMYYYSARYYAPPVFISRDPLFEKYPTYSPYCYTLNNPVRFIDPDGRKVVITGDQADGAVSQMQSRSENLEFTRDAETGEISVTGKAKTAEEKYMQKIINDQKITVNFTASNNEKTTQGQTYNIGAFMGNTVEKDANGKTTHVNAYQEYNVSKGADADKKVNSPGNFIWHEMAEGFEGGKISAKSGVSAGIALEGVTNSVYDAAHYRAGAYFPGQYNTKTISTTIPIPDLSFPYSPHKTTKVKVYKEEHKLVR